MAAGGARDTVETMAAKDDETKPGKLSPVSLATWARLASAGKGPDAGKPRGAENWSDNPENPKRKKTKR